MVFGCHFIKGVGIWFVVYRGSFFIEILAATSGEGVGGSLLKFSLRKSGQVKRWRYIQAILYVFQILLPNFIREKDKYFGKLMHWKWVCLSAFRIKPQGKSIPGTCLWYEVDTHVCTKNLYLHNCINMFICSTSYLLSSSYCVTSNSEFLFSIINVI